MSYHSIVFTHTFTPATGGGYEQHSKVSLAARQTPSTVDATSLAEPRYPSAGFTTVPLGVVIAVESIDSAACSVERVERLII